MFHWKNYQENITLSSQILPYKLSKNKIKSCDSVKPPNDDVRRKLNDALVIIKMCVWNTMGVLLQFG